MKGINLLLLSGVCGFLVACGNAGVVTNQGGNQYTSCSITVDTEGLPTVGADPLLAYQWYLDKAYVKEAWVTYKEVYDDLLASEKKEIQIAVVDDALQVDHEDLKDNVIPGASINLLVGESSPNRNYPYPIDCAEDGHGTAVAGIIAAQGDNGRGVKGVASHGGNNIKIWGANLVASSQVSDRMIRAVFEHRVPLTAVSSNSWGLSQPTRLSRTGTSFNMLINTGLSTGFGGKGISYVFAAGNERASAGPERYPLSDRASYSEILNQPGIIPVCAAGFDDILAPYSEPGPNIWICGYSATNQSSVNKLKDSVITYKNNINPEYFKFHGLATTDLSGTNGYNEGDDTVLKVDGGECNTYQLLTRFPFDFASAQLIYDERGTCPNLSGEEDLEWRNGATTSYTRYFSGTSAATPMVSGVIGLIRSAYPNLTWRDIKLILAESAWQPPASTALEGARAYRNDNHTHRYSHSHDYGFGIVNASAAMDLAAIWEDNRTILSGPQTVYPVPDTVPAASFSSSTNINVPSDNDAGLSFIEYVQVEIDKSELDFGTLNITLTSPSGATSIFAVVHECIDIEPGDDTGKVSENCNDLEDGFTFGSAVHLGESPMGDWRLSVTSSAGANPVVNWKLRLYGH